MTTPYKIAVIVSGNGSNLQALINAINQHALPIKIAVVISNKQNAYALVRAKNANIPIAIFDKDSNNKTYSRTAFEQLALETVGFYQVDMVVLAGFMRILTPLFIDGVRDLGIAMINLHPSLLPYYKGLDTHQRVLETGDKCHGCTVHLVSSELDSGQIIAQACLSTTCHDTPSDLQQRVHKLEHKLLPMVVGLFANKIIHHHNGKITSAVIELPLMIA